MDLYLVCVYVLTCVLGLCVGSFLNVVIYRLPKGMSLAVPSSRCTKCGYSLRWYDNIPVISFVFLRGKCRKCRAPISFRYVAVEFVNALLWLLSVWRFWMISPLYAGISALVCSCLICIFFIDLDCMLIFDRFTVLIALCGAGAVFVDSYTLFDHLIGAVIGGGIFSLLYYCSLAILKKEGLGFGDVKLSCAVGLLLGWQRYILAMLIASVAGSAVLITLNRIKDGSGEKEYPFGPFIVLGTAVAWFFGEGMIEWYVNLLLG